MLVDVFAGLERGAGVDGTKGGGRLGSLSM